MIKESKKFDFDILFFCENILKSFFLRMIDTIARKNYYNVSQLFRILQTNSLIFAGEN